MSGDASTLLSVRDLTVTFKARGQLVQAVRGVSFDIGEGETLGLVGESGSGKTTIARAILGLIPVTSGSISFRGRDVTHLGRRERRALARDLQAIFQDPYGSFNPALRIEKSLTEGMEAAGAPGAETRARLADLLGQVGLPADAARKFPSEFSGGQRQRLGIARALMQQPALVVCDEVVSALDVSVQAQVLNLLRQLRRDTGLSYLFIGHDLNVIRYMSDRVIVLYRGDLVEEGPADEVIGSPQQEYTRALVAAIPEV